MGLLTKNFNFADNIKSGKQDILEFKNNINKLAHCPIEWNLPLNFNKCKVMHIGYKISKAEYKFLK